VTALSWELVLSVKQNSQYHLVSSGRVKGTLLQCLSYFFWHSMYLLLMSKIICNNNWLNLTELLPLKLLVRKIENLHQDETVFEHLLSKIHNLLTKHCSGGHSCKSITVTGYIWEK